MCQEKNIPEFWKETILRQVCGTMALSGLPLTNEDKERIRYLLDYPDEQDSMMKALIEKHRKG